MIESPATPVRLLHVTDPHLFGDETRTLYDVRTTESLRQVLAEAVESAGRPDAIVVTGDIAEDHTPEAYRNFRRALEPYGLPVYCLPGNHDEPTVMPALVGHSGFQYCGSARFGAWGSVFLDTHVRRRPEGRVEHAELERLERELQRMHDRPVMVGLHHPPLPVGSPWLDAVGLVNADELFEVLDRHATVRVVLGGHVHQAFERRHGGALVLATPSTCAQFTPGTERCVMDLKPPGYRLLELAPDGGVRTEVRWLQSWNVSERPPDDRR